MTHFLDTNVCVNYLRSSGGSEITRRLLGFQAGDVMLCSVVKAELMYGVERSRNKTQNLAQVKNFFTRFPSVPFDDAAAEAYGFIRSQLAIQGTPIGPNDLMIAAIALANDLTLVTHNLAEFGRGGGLKMEDWEA